MKKLLFIAALALTLSCSKEEECNCNAQFVTETGGFYTVPNLPVDCETKTPIEDNSNTGGGYFVGCKN